MRSASATQATMGPRDRQHSIRPKAPTLLALLLFAAALAVAVPTLRRPERAGWIALPPAPMDATDPDIRELLRKSAQAAPAGRPALAAACGADEVEPERLPPDFARPPALPDDDEAPMEERYALLLGGPGQSAWRLDIEVSGERARLRALAPGVGAAERELPLAALAPLRAALDAPELWSAPQRSAVFCADRHRLRQAFFEACVDGRYYARDRACDRNAWPLLDALWRQARAVAPTPASAPTPAGAAP
ncbi:hypothetical protein J5226_08085 [Lysobacter sp. K5869]|uniref:hypothetical protein n=1 Tax=Lysobacter sp. K5869 TaxID=2820808 RepID=UPI001C061D70|nr:hypothetical protein [Lysobacter sp. K5869]QWP78337.1 hypothetical protein J5226_08085 [Lysobacter sp. K5869]